jgi:hypothetical protein
MWAHPLKRSTADLATPQGGGARSPRSKRVARLALAAALLSGAAGLAWWTGLIPTPDWQPSSVWQSVMLVTQR